MLTKHSPWFLEIRVSELIQNHVATSLSGVFHMTNGRGALAHAWSSLVLDLFPWHDWDDLRMITNTVDNFYFYWEEGVNRRWHVRS